MDRTGEQARRQDVRESSEMAQILTLFLGSTKRSRLRGPGGRHVSMPPGMRTREREREGEMHSTGRKTWQEARGNHMQWVRVLPTSGPLGIGPGYHFVLFPDDPSPKY